VQAGAGLRDAGGAGRGGALPRWGQGAAARGAGSQREARARPEARQG